MSKHSWDLLGIIVSLFLVQVSVAQQDSPAPAPSANPTPARGCRNSDSLFQSKYNYPVPWWVVQPSEVPQVANTALVLRSALTTSYEDFAKQIIIAVARNQTQDIAKSIGYMINANATLGGGCPVPPPPSAFLQRVGDGFAATVTYASNTASLLGNATPAQLNVTEDGMGSVNASSLTDAILGAMFIAGRSCGPPNALSSSTLAAIRQKYIESTCYYAGPIFRAVTNNQTVEPPCYNSTFEADIAMANQTDVYVSGPLLSAYKECINGPPEVLNPPSWLNYSFGPIVSIDSVSSKSGGSINIDSITEDDLDDGDDSADVVQYSSTMGRRMLRWLW